MARWSNGLRRWSLKPEIGVSFYGGLSQYADVAARFNAAACEVVDPTLWSGGSNPLIRAKAYTAILFLMGLVKKSYTRIGTWRAA